MRKIYFIDSENVGDSWVSLLDTVAADDELMVFYTAKSPHMNYKQLIHLKESSKDVSFIECFEGSNALDFQLCTELGYQIRQMPDSEFVIVTNDTGYDAVVKYWTKKNIPVRRIQGKDCLPAAPAETSRSAEASQPAETSHPAETSGEKTAAKISETEAAADGMDSRAKEILYIIGKDNLQALHESLTQIFGSKKGKTYYDAFKSDMAYANSMAKHKKLSPAEKQSLYCSIVFELSEADVAMPKGFPKFAVDTWKKKKNLNSFRSALQAKYGKEKSDKYYAIIKAHMKLLDKIK